MKKILKIIGKSIVAIFALLCVLIFVQSFVLDKILYPNNLYIERNEINDNKTLISELEDEDIEDDDVMEKYNEIVEVINSIC